MCKTQLAPSSFDFGATKKRASDATTERQLSVSGYSSSRFMICTPHLSREKAVCRAGVPFFFPPRSLFLSRFLLFARCVSRVVPLFSFARGSHPIISFVPCFFPISFLTAGQLRLRLYKILAALCTRIHLYIVHTVLALLYIRIIIIIIEYANLVMTVAGCRS